MKSLPSTFLLATLASVALGGCTSLFGIRFASNHQNVRTSADARLGKAAPGTGTSATQEGRSHLTDGQPGLAIEAFQRALKRGERVAPALNGLGVAYSRIGRKDLAVRYFEQALAADPQNSQFAQNLGRTYHAMALANARQIELAEQASAGATAPAKSTLASAMAAGNPQRSSRPEIRIATRADSARSAQRITNLESRFQPLVRIEFARAPSSETGQRKLDVAENFKPIVRIRLENPSRSNMAKAQLADVGARPLK